jgi:hypothetical protein
VSLPSNFQLLGGDVLEGERGAFAVRHGMLDVGLLDWLRSALPGLDSPTWSFKSKSGQKDRKVELGRKMELMGHFMSNKRESKRSLFGLSCAAPFPDRFRAFRKAFMAVNAEALTSMKLRIDIGLADFSDEELSKNGKALCEENLQDIMCCHGTLQMMAGGAEARTDPKHFDGGPSFWHGALTLHGSRTLHFEMKNGTSAKLEISAGHFYFGTLCSALHFVSHEPENDHEQLWNSAGLGKVRVVLLMRSLAFRHCRASNAANTPNPKQVFEASAAAVSQALASESWRLPSLTDCVAALEGLEA